MIWGWHVLPLKPHDKTPLTKHGLLDASDDTAQIEDWWNQWPEANIGLRTGVIFDVLDIDGPAGLTAFTTVATPYHHDGPLAATGKGGFHLLFATTGAKNGANLVDKVDFRGTNGYIVAPPSIHPNGRTYRWLRDGPLPTAPDWLTPLLPMPAPEPRISFSDAVAPILNPTRAAALNVPILQVFNEYFPGFSATKRGKHYACPFHEDSTPSLVLYDHNNTFHCFGCGANGDGINISHYARHGQLRFPNCARCAEA